MIIPLQNILFLKEFIACNRCFKFTKIKKQSGTSFWCMFSEWFFHKNVPHLILYLVSIPYLFLLKIWNKMLLSSYLDSSCIINFKIYLGSSSKKNGWQGEKEEKMEIQKFEYLKNGKSISGEIKNIFYSFWRAIIWWKIRICSKISDTSFKLWKQSWSS